ncbi:unnamed protein product [Urochloa humidicola]
MQMHIAAKRAAAGLVRTSLKYKPPLFQEIPKSIWMPHIGPTKRAKARERDEEEGAPRSALPRLSTRTAAPAGAAAATTQGRRASAAPPARHRRRAPALGPPRRAPPLPLSRAGGAPRRPIPRRELRSFPCSPQLRRGRDGRLPPGGAAARAGVEERGTATRSEPAPRGSVLEHGPGRGRRSNSRAAWGGATTGRASSPAAGPRPARSRGRGRRAWPELLHDGRPEPMLAPSLLLRDGRPEPALTPSFLLRDGRPELRRGGRLGEPARELHRAASQPARARVGVGTGGRLLEEPPPGRAPPRRRGPRW